MAFPWIFESNWEDGSIQWDSESDTATALDIAHYTDLARFPWKNCAPFSGAYCLRLKLDGGTADSILLEASGNIAANGVGFAKFDIWFSPDFDATADDTCTLLEFLASGTTEATVGFRYVASTDVINMGIGETAATSFASNNMRKGEWYTVEVKVEVDEGTQDDGAIDLYVYEPGQVASTTTAATQVGTLDQGAVTDIKIGISDHLATTTGTILIDNFVMDDAQIGSSDRYPYSKLLTSNEHVFVGSGAIESVDLINSTGTDTDIRLYDTDKAEVLQEEKLWLQAGVAEEIVSKDFSGEPLKFDRGCYAVLAGTSPQAMVKIKRASAYGSDELVRRHGQRQPA